MATSYTIKQQNVTSIAADITKYGTRSIFNDLKIIQSTFAQTPRIPPRLALQ